MTVCGHVLAEGRAQLVALLQAVDHRVEAARQVLELVARVHGLDVHVVELLDPLERGVHALQRVRHDRRQPRAEGHRDDARRPRGRPGRRGGSAARWCWMSVTSSAASIPTLPMRPCELPRLEALHGPGAVARVDDRRVRRRDAPTAPLGNSGVCPTSSVVVARDDDRERQLEPELRARVLRGTRRRRAGRRRRAPARRDGHADDVRRRRAPTSATRSRARPRRGTPCPCAAPRAPGCRRPRRAGCLQPTWASTLAVRLDQQDVDVRVDVDEDAAPARARARRRGA